jgi:hypothetical protein
MDLKKKEKEKRLVTKSLLTEIYKFLIKLYNINKP